MIQTFNLGLSSTATLKSLEYSLLLKEGFSSKTTLQGVKDFQKELATLLDLKNEISVLFNEKDNDPRLIEINTKFYYSDICTSAQEDRKFVDFQTEARKRNFETLGLDCKELLKGSLGRGTNSLYLYLQNLILRWEHYISVNGRRAIIEEISKDEELAELEVAFVYFQFLVNIQTNNLNNERKQLLDETLTKQILWLALGLPLILFSLNFFWQLFHKVMHQTFLVSLSPLDLFSAYVISNNKALVSRLNAFRKNQAII